MSARPDQSAHAFLFQEDDIYWRFVSDFPPTHRARISNIAGLSLGDFREVMVDWLCRLNRCYLGVKWDSTANRGRIAAALAVNLYEGCNKPETVICLMKAPTSADEGHFAVHAAFLFQRSYRDRFATISVGASTALANIEIIPLEDEQTGDDIEVPF